MLEIIVIGESEFTMGFRLAGISRVVDIQEEDDPEQKVEEAFSAEGAGILVTSPAIMEKLSADLQEKLRTSVSPVTVVVSEKDEMGNLREAIKKAIGVDVWK